MAGENGNDLRHLSFRLRNYTIVGEPVVEDNFIVMEAEKAGLRKRIYRSREYLLVQEKLIERIVDNASEYGKAVQPTHHLRLEVDKPTEGEPNLFMVEDLDDGVTLHDVLGKERDLPEEAVVGYITDLLEALEPFHKLGFVYGSTDPRDVRIVETPNGKTLKLGALFKLHKPEQPVQLAYSPEFAAPETTDASVTFFSRDIYGVGMLAYRMLIGRDAYRQQFSSAFDSAGDGNVKKNDVWRLIHTNRSKFRPVRDLNPNVAAEVADVVEHMQNMGSDLRYKDARDAREALARAWQKAKDRRHREKVERETWFTTPDGRRPTVTVRRSGSPLLSGPNRSRWLLAGSLAASVLLFAGYKVFVEPAQIERQAELQRREQEVVDLAQKAEAERQRAVAAGVVAHSDGSDLKKQHASLHKDQEARTDAFNNDTVEIEVARTGFIDLGKKFAELADAAEEVKKEAARSTAAFRGKVEKFSKLVPEDDANLAKFRQVLKGSDGAIASGAHDLVAALVSGVGAEIDGRQVTLSAAKQAAEDARAALAAAADGAMPRMERLAPDNPIRSRYEKAQAAVANVDTLLAARSWEEARAAAEASAAEVAASVADLDARLAQTQGLAEAAVAARQALSPYVGDGDAAFAEASARLDAAIAAIGAGDPAEAESMIAAARSVFETRLAEIREQEGRATEALAVANAAREDAANARATRLASFAAADGRLVEAAEFVQARRYADAVPLLQQATAGFEGAATRAGRLVGELEAAVAESQRLKAGIANLAAVADAEAIEALTQEAAALAAADDLEAALEAQIDAQRQLAAASKDYGDLSAALATARTGAERALEEARNMNVATDALSPGEQDLAEARRLADDGQLKRAVEYFDGARTTFLGAKEEHVARTARTAELGKSIKALEAAFADLLGSRERDGIVSTTFNAAWKAINEHDLDTASKLIAELEAQLQEESVRIAKVKEDVAKSRAEAVAARDAIDPAWAEGLSDAEQGRLALAEGEGLEGSGEWVAAADRYSYARSAFARAGGIAAEGVGKLAALQADYDAAAAEMEKVFATDLPGYPGFQQLAAAVSIAPDPPAKLAALEDALPSAEKLLAEVKALRQTAEEARKALSGLVAEIEELRAGREVAELAALQQERSAADGYYDSSAFGRAKRAYVGLVASYQKLRDELGQSLAMACSVEGGPREMIRVNAGAHDLSQIAAKRRFEQQIRPFVDASGGVVSVPAQICIQSRQVTTAEFRRYLDSLPASELAEMPESLQSIAADDKPVTGVPRPIAADYASWLSATLGRTYRLPRAEELLAAFATPDAAPDAAMEAGEGWDWTVDECSQHIGLTLKRGKPATGPEGDCRLDMSHLHTDVGIRLVLEEGAPATAAVPAAVPPQPEAPTAEPVPTISATPQPAPVSRPVQEGGVAAGPPPEPAQQPDMPGDGGDETEVPLIQAN